MTASRATVAIPRLYSDQQLAAGARIALQGDRARYAGRVLRCRRGDALILFDGRGNEFPASVREASKRELVLQLGEKYSRDVESPLSVRLIQGVSRGDRFDIVIQKATELGVRRISPLLSEFSVVRLDTERARSRGRHWQRIAASACEQCGRNTLPQIDAPASLAECLASAAPGGVLRLVLQPGSGPRIADPGPAPDELELLIGPEGGFSDDEQAQAAAAGFTAIGMGPRVLRTETAAIAALALAQAHWGDL